MSPLIEISTADAAPIWRQIEERVRRLVQAGTLAPGCPVPSVRDLARTLRINPATVAKAYQRLTDAGVLQVRRGMVAVTAGCDLLLQDAEGVRGRHPVQRCGEGAHPLAARHEALGLQLADGTVHRHAADAELGHQFGLGGHQCAGRPAAAGQALLQVLLDAGVGCLGDSLGAGPRGNHGANATCIELSRQVECNPEFSTVRPCHLWSPP